MPDDPAAPIETNDEFDHSFDLPPAMIPASDREAVDWIVPLLDLDRARLARVDGEAFKKAWFAIAFLMPGLHPDGSTEISVEVASIGQENLSGPVAEHRKIVTPFFRESGWPVALVPLAGEAWRRRQAGRLEDHEMYPVSAAHAGIAFAQNRAQTARVVEAYLTARDGGETQAVTPARA